MEQPQFQKCAFNTAIPVQLTGSINSFLTNFSRSHVLTSNNDQFKAPSTNATHATTIKACMHQQNVQQKQEQEHQEQSILGKDFYSIDPSQLEDDEYNLLRSFVKVRASLNPEEEAIYTFSGTVYGFLNGNTEKTKPLFKLQGYSIARAVPIDMGYRLLTREVGFYTSLSDDKPLAMWTNEYTDEEVNVVHIWNDPVNQDMICNSKLPIHVKRLEKNNQMTFTVDVFPKYRNPLDNNNIYESSELFSFFVDEHELKENTSFIKNVNLSWCRVGPWLPWMKMDKNIDGKLVYHCQGQRLDEIPEYFRHWIMTLNEKNGMKFFKAPWIVSEPNETSWSYMKKLIENKSGYPRADGRIARKESSKKSVKTSENVHLYLTKCQLKAFKGGEDENIPVYVSVAGYIFNVSEARRHYGYGETYNCLTGIDASKALLSGQLQFEEEQTDIDWNGLGDEEVKTLSEWVKFFNQRYQCVGTLLDFDGPKIPLQSNN